MNRVKGPVESVLKHGEDNAMTGAEIMQLLAISNSRALRNAISSEREAGALILSTVRGHGGYFLPSLDPAQAREEIIAFQKTVRNRALNSIRILRASRMALAGCDGQIGFDYEGDEEEDEQGTTRLHAIL